MVHFYLYPILMGMAGGGDGELRIKRPWPKKVSEEIGTTEDCHTQRTNVSEV